VSKQVSTEATGNAVLWQIAESTKNIQRKICNDGIVWIVKTKLIISLLNKYIFFAVTMLIMWIYTY